MKVTSVFFNKKTKEIHLGSLLWIDKPEEYEFLGIHKYADEGDLLKELLKWIPEMGLSTQEILEAIKKQYPEHLV
jgi:hypothetical protein